MLNVGFPVVDWEGGAVYVTTLIHALRISVPEAGRFIVQEGGEVVPEMLRAEIDGVIEVRRPGPRTARGLAARAAHRFFSQDPTLEAALRERKIDALFGFVLSAQPGRVPLLSCIPDFQHVHLPEMFSAEERHSRDKVFTESARVSSRIVLMSNAVRADFEAFAPRYASKARVLEIAVDFSASVYAEDSLKTALRYGLPEKFAYFPAQLWKHKNHEIVIEAVKLIRDSGLKIQVVCTGDTRDYRHRDHFEWLKAKVHREGLGEQVRFLGFVPREDVVSLLRRSSFLINASFFEGCSMTAEEGRSMGKRMLLSDIPVHREKKGSDAIFFDPRSPRDLAAKLASIWESASPGPHIFAENEARLEIPARLARSAKSFLSILEEL